jgi:hypothetical protein
MKKATKGKEIGEKKHSMLRITIDDELKKWVNKEAELQKMTPTEIGRVAIKYFLEQDGCKIREAIGRLGENQMIRQLKKKREKLQEELEKVNLELRMQNTEKARETLAGGIPNLRKGGRKEAAGEDHVRGGTTVAVTNEKEGVKT